MKRQSGTVLALLAILAASGCSRTYDGSIVPTYEVATDRIAGIPYLTLKETPLDPPNMRGLNVPPPEGVAEDNYDTSGPAAVPRPASRRPVLRRALPPRLATAAKPLHCRDETPGTQPVRVLCE